MDQQIKQFIIERLQERTTWTGIFQLVPILTGFTIAPEYLDSFVAIGIALGAGHKMITKG